MPNNTNFNSFLKQYSLFKKLPTYSFFASLALSFIWGIIIAIGVSDMFGQGGFLGFLICMIIGGIIGFISYFVVGILISPAVLTTDIALNSLSDEAFETPRATFSNKTASVSTPSSTGNINKIDTKKINEAITSDTWICSCGARNKSSSNECCSCFNKKS